MLWYKGWLETRLRLLIALGLTGILLALSSIRPPAQPVPKPTLGLYFVWMMCATFPGAGINSQLPFWFLKGLHGSTIHLVIAREPVPVAGGASRSRMAGNGWRDSNVLLRMWRAAPVLFQGVTGFEMFEYVVTAIACASAPYFLSVLLLTFLDDQWRSWGA